MGCSTQTAYYAPVISVDIEVMQMNSFGYAHLLSLGREYPEPEHEFRSPFERDRDRVVHSTAFRRLAKKTQVYPSPSNDHHRTRLTHTIEVAQISRVVARNLGLEEDLTEAIALAHDLGHPPFGHAGEEELDLCMADCGGFEHNSHALRIVTRLEYRYPAFMGLNLTWEVREAFAHHSKKLDSEILHYRSKGAPFLEAQVADAVDSLAYDAHDVEDAITAGLVTLEEFLEVPLIRELVTEIQNLGPMTNARAQVPTLIRNLINKQAGDLIVQTRRNLESNRIASLADVRSMGALLVTNSHELLTKIKQLEIFLKSRVYHHHRVQRMAIRGRRVVRQLFEEFCKFPKLLPGRYQLRVENCGLRRTVCDYIAGMTDQFAIREYRKLFSPEEPV